MENRIGSLKVEYVDEKTYKRMFFLKYELPSKMMLKVSEVYNNAEFKKNA